MNTQKFRRTGRTQRMIDAAIKAALGRDESGKPKEVIIVTAPREARWLFRKIQQRLFEMRALLGVFDWIEAEYLISFTRSLGAQIQILTTEHPIVDTNRLEVVGFKGLVYFDHFAIEWLYGHAIEKWLELFIKGDQQ